jgi:hypothetical protein
MRELKALEGTLQDAVNGNWKQVGVVNMPHFEASTQFGFTENGKPVNVSVSVSLEPTFVDKGFHKGATLPFDSGGDIRINISGPARWRDDENHSLPDGPRADFTPYDPRPLLQGIAKKANMPLTDYVSKRIPDPRAESLPLGEQNFRGPDSGELVYASIGPTYSRHKEYSTSLSFVDRDEVFPKLLIAVRSAISEYKGTHKPAALDP